MEFELVAELRPVAADNTFAVDDTFSLDAALYYGKRPWRFQINLENLTDEETFTRAFVGSSVIPAPGFTASAGFRLAL